MAAIDSIQHDHFENMDAVKEIYIIGDVLGYGSYGMVFKSIEIKTKIVKALKILLKNDAHNSDRSSQEIKILTKIKHPNIIILNKVLETPQKLLLVFEYCPRQLRKILDERKVLEEHEIQQIMRYLISAVYYLHLNAIVHRDLKIDNILLTDNPSNPNDEWYIKLIDFGLSSTKHSVIVRQSNQQALAGPVNMLAEFCGTPQYMAPELITKSYSLQCDIWSIGVIMYLLFKGSFPYQLTDAFQNSKNYINAKEIITNTIVDYDSIESTNDAIDLIKKCLTINPAMRITAGEMLYYIPWISGVESRSASGCSSGGTNILLLMEQFNNNKRCNSCTDIASELPFNSNANMTNEYRTSEEKDSEFLSIKGKIDKLKTKRNLKKF